MKEGLSRWQAKTKAKLISENGVLKLAEVYRLIDETLGIIQFDDCKGCKHSISTAETARENAYNCYDCVRQPYRVDNYKRTKQCEE